MAISQRTRELLNKNPDMNSELRWIMENSDNQIDTLDERYRQYKAIYENQGDPIADYIKQIYLPSTSREQMAYDSARQILGREVNSSELAQILPYFNGDNGVQTGNAYLAELAEQYKKSPEYLDKQAGQYSGQVGEMVKSLLGRDAKQDELDYYGKYLARGMDPFELRKQLEGSQEYQGAQDKSFREGLASELEGYDTSFFNKAKEGVLSRFSKAGGGVGQSSALDFALTDLMGQIAEKRGSYLAGISSQQYGGNKENARNDYQAGMNRYFQDQDYDRNKRDAELGYYRSRSDADSDYTRQKNDYYDMIARSKQGNGTFHTGDWLNLGLNAANTGVRAYGAAQSGGGMVGIPYQGPYNYWNT
jgi:hypothetical protein